MLRLFFGRVTGLPKRRIASTAMAGFGGRQKLASCKKKKLCTYNELINSIENDLF